MHYIIIVLLIIIREEGIASCLLTATIMDHSLIASALPWWYSKYNIDYGPQYIHHITFKLYQNIGNMGTLFTELFHFS